MKIEVCVYCHDADLKESFILELPNTVLNVNSTLENQQQLITFDFINRVSNFIRTRNIDLSLRFYALEDTNKILYYFAVSPEYLCDDIDNIVSLVTAGINHAITGAQFNIIAKS